MRPVREITAQEEHFRTEPIAPHMETIRRDPVEPEPVGTIVLMAFRVTGYDPDCDGSLMARLMVVDKDGQDGGWEPSNIGLCPECDLVVTPDELRQLFEGDPAERERARCVAMVREKRDYYRQAADEAVGADMARAIFLDIAEMLDALADAMAEEPTT